MGLGVQTQPTSLNSRENGVCSFSSTKADVMPLIYFLCLYEEERSLLGTSGSLRCWSGCSLPRTSPFYCHCSILCESSEVIFSPLSNMWAKSRRRTLGYNHWILFTFVCEADELRVPLFAPDKCVKLCMHEPKNLHLDPRRMVSFFPENNAPFVDEDVENSVIWNWCFQLQRGQWDTEPPQHR